MFTSPTQVLGQGPPDYHLLTVNANWLGAGNGVTVLSAATLDRTLRLRGHGTYFWALGAGTGSVLAAYLLLRSRVGLALTAIRDDETAARSLGVNVLRTKVLVYLAAALGCGLAGEREPVALPPKADSTCFATTRDELRAAG